MPKVNEIRTALFEAAPEYMKMEWDNVGLMCGHAAQEVTRVQVALDASYRVLNEAKAAHCELVVCHHPLIFGGTKTVTDETPVGRSLLFAIENGISVLSFHTNLDCAPEGVNDVLARSLGLSEVTVMEPAGTDEQGRAYGLIRTGTVSETDVRSFAAQVKQALGCEGLRYADGGRPVHRVAVGGALQVNRLCPDHAGNAAFQPHPLADDHPGVHPAHRVEAQQAALLDVGDDKADLIHVGGKEHLVFGGFLALLLTD